MSSPTKTETDFQLIETMFYTPGKDRPVGTLLYDPSPARPNQKISDMDFALMKPHMLRLKKSAVYFQFNFGSQYARRCAFKAVKAFEKEQKKQQTLRVRLLLNKTGLITVSCFPFTPAVEDTIISFVISDKRLQSDDIFLKHKTTHREVFDSEHARLSEETGCDEVLFLNERDELCEGSRSNLFILPAEAEDEILLTPPLSSGLLPGTLRAKMLQRGKAKEAVLDLKDLENAQQIYFGNSVRGLQRAKLAS